MREEEDRIAGQENNFGNSVDCGDEAEPKCGWRYKGSTVRSCKSFPGRKGGPILAGDFRALERFNHTGINLANTLEGKNAKYNL